MAKQTFICPWCHREVGVTGKGAKAKLAAHNGTRRDFLLGTRISEDPCLKGSGLLVLSLQLEEAEREHTNAKRHLDTANLRLKQAEAEVQKAEAELHRTAAELDRLRAIK